jgi:hypothetical protein
MNNTHDTITIETVIHALYDVISGDQGEARNWARVMDLFHPDGTLHIINEDGSHLNYRPEEYARNFTEVLENPGVYETEENREEHIHGNLATVISYYATYTKRGDEKPFKRGVNLLQLWYGKGRWWILNITWDRGYNVNEKQI